MGGALTVAVAGVLVAGCSGGSSGSVGSTAAPAGTGTPSAPAASSAPAATTSGSGSTGGSGDGGCTKTSARIPPAADVATSVDLDGDGSKDRVWLAEADGDRTLGVTTASGATFSTTFATAAPQRASAVGVHLAAADVVLLDTGRSVSLYAVSDCRLVPSKNKQGRQYTFDLGFTGFGTGVTCDDRILYGELAKEGGDGRYSVTTTAIDLSDDGTQARNGATTTVARGLAASSSAVEDAHGVNCGTGIAHEPAS